MEFSIARVKRHSFSKYVIIRSNGLVIPMLGEPFVNYATKVDIKNKLAINEGDTLYGSVNWPTINDLIATGHAEDGDYLKTVEWEDRRYDGCHHFPGPPDFKAIQQYFKDRGFRVSISALKHNFDAWKCDCKSGYRGKGFFVFTPCGCNILSFSVSKLDSHCKSWQHTYIA